MNRMTSRIMLICCFGIDIADEEVDYWVNGKKEKRPIGVAASNTFNSLVQRVAAPHIQIFPFLAYFFLTTAERDAYNNAMILRAKVQSIIDNRRQVIKDNPQKAEEGDFLTLILCEPFFKNKDKRVIDECLTFFFAGFITSSTAVQNLIFALCKHPEYQQKILDELNSEIV